MNFSKVEKEVIFLKAINELIDSMVNHEVLDIYGTDPNSEIRFNSTTHQKYFNIILVDFLSRSDKRAIGEEHSYLSAIRSICESPNFTESDSINSLKSATEDFIAWLEQEVQVSIWLPSIEQGTVLSIKRVDFLKICGNISKHNFSRLSVTAKELMNIFKRNCINIDLGQALLVLDEFYERFHSDILEYHGGTIAEFLNNIRWGIHEYLQPEFQQSIVYNGSEHPQRYHYTYPEEINSEFAENCYWDLMNEVRLKPHMRRFQVTHYSKIRY